MKALIFLLLFLVGAGVQKISAQDKSNDTTARYFIIQASIGNLQEVAVGKLAVRQARSAEVKSFAQRMVADHSDIEGQLKELIKAKGFQIPSAALDSPVEDMMLKDLNGDKFDQVYVHMMVPDHRQTVQLFQKYALTGKDPVVKDFAQRVLPLLKEHLVAITAIDDRLNEMHKGK